MRKWLFGALAALLLAAMAMTGAADSEGAVVQSSCSIVQSGDHYLVYCYAQIHNNSDMVIALEQGSFELHGGEQILATQDVNQLWPAMINPGEDAYVFDVVAFEPDENGQPVIPQVTGIVYDIAYMAVDAEFASLALDAQPTIETDKHGGITALVTIHNPTQIMAMAPTVSFGLYTDGGAMVYADGLTLHNVGIPAGGSIVVRFPVDDAISEQWNSYGAKITQARAMASFRDGTD